VDIGRPRPVQEVSLWNRFDCCSDRLKGFEVRVTDKKDYKSGAKCGDRRFDAKKKKMSPGVVVKCDGYQGRYVYVVLPHNRPLTLCEVELKVGGAAKKPPVKKPPAAQNVPTGQVSLTGGKSKNTRYCADEGNKVKCNRGHVAGWEKFTLRSLGNNKYSLQGGKNKRYCADEGGQVKCNRGHVAGWEKFTLKSLGNNKYSLKGGRGNRYCADEGNRVKCNRGHVAGWEKFTLTKLRV